MRAAVLEQGRVLLIVHGSIQGGRCKTSNPEWLNNKISKLNSCTKGQCSVWTQWTIAAFKKTMPGYALLNVCGSVDVYCRRGGGGILIPHILQC